ncbi:MAG: response regulator, partial [Bdellovibrionales bacterium]|nr:response regulator [Bdellovibrionales bacterium]
VFRFTIRAPRAEAPAGVKAAAAGRPLRILLAEDNQVNRMVVQGMLEKMGHSCAVAVNGVEAVKAVESAPGFDLVLMDCNMPEMDGYAATGKIRLRYPDMPILALTASAMQEDVDRCLAGGMNGFLSKPVSLQKLSETLAEYADRERQAPLSLAVDETSLLAHFDGDRDVLDRLVTAYLETYPAMADRLRRSLGNGEELYAAAHTLKGCLANFFARRAVELAEILELQGRKRRLWGARRRCFLLLRECERVNGQLRGMSGGRRAA